MRELLNISWTDLFSDVLLNLTKLDHVTLIDAFKTQFQRIILFDFAILVALPGMQNQQLLEIFTPDFISLFMEEARVNHEMLLVVHEACLIYKTRGHFFFQPFEDLLELYISFQMQELEKGIPLKDLIRTRTYNNLGTSRLNSDYEVVGLLNLCLQLPKSKRHILNPLFDFLKPRLSRLNLKIIPIETYFGILLMNRFERLQPIFHSKVFEFDIKSRKGQSTVESNFFSKTKMNDFLILTLFKGIDVSSSSQTTVPAQNLSTTPKESNFQSHAAIKFEKMMRNYEQIIPKDFDIFRKTFKSGEDLVDLYGMITPTNNYISIHDSNFISSQYIETDSLVKYEIKMKMFDILKIKDLIAFLNKIFNACMFNNDRKPFSSLSNLYELMQGRGLELVLSDTDISSKLLLLSRVMSLGKIGKANIDLLNGLKKFYDGFVSGDNLAKWQDRVIHENLSTPAMVNFQYKSEFFLDFMPLEITKRNNLLDKTLVTSFFQPDEQSLDPIAPHLTECFAKRANEYHLALQNRGSDFMAQCVATCDFLDVAEEILAKNKIVYVRKKIEFPFVHDFEIQMRGQRLYLNLLTDSKLCFGTPVQLVQNELMKIFSYKEGFLPCPDKMLWFWPSVIEVEELLFERQLLEFLNLALDGDQVMLSKSELDLSAPNGCKNMMTFSEMQTMLRPVLASNKRSRDLYQEKKNGEYDATRQSFRSEPENTPNRRFDRNRTNVKENKSSNPKMNSKRMWTDDES